MARFSILVLTALVASVHGLRIRCSEGKLPGGPGGSQGIPFKMLTIGDELCDFFQGTAGPCQDEVRTGKLKGKSTCNGAVYFTTGDTMNVELADGSKHSCVPPKGTHDCDAP